MQHLSLVDSYFQSLEKQRYSQMSWRKITVNYHSDSKTFTLSFLFPASILQHTRHIFTNEHCKMKLKIHPPSKNPLSSFFSGQKLPKVSILEEDQMVPTYKASQLPPLWCSLQNSQETRCNLKLHSLIPFYTHTQN